MSATPASFGRNLAVIQNHAACQRRRDRLAALDPPTLHAGEVELRPMRHTDISAVVAALEDHPEIWAHFLPPGVLNLRDYAGHVARLWDNGDGAVWLLNAPNLVGLTCAIVDPTRKGQWAIGGGAFPGADLGAIEITAVVRTVADWVRETFDGDTPYVWIACGDDRYITVAKRLGLGYVKGVI